MTSSSDPIGLTSPLGPVVLEDRSPVRALRDRLERLGRRRSLAILDVAAAVVIVGTFAQVAPPELLFHIVFVILTAEAFLFGRRICLQRIAAVSIALVIYASLPVLGVAVAPLELTEWPLMFTIAVLVAWMADREQSVARRFAGLYQEARDRLVRAQEEERARVARDLHDGIGQTLTALALRLDAYAATHDAPTSSHDLERARQLAREAIDDARLAAERIRPPRMEARGLAGALRALGSVPGGNVDVAVGPGAEIRLLPIDTELEVYRIAQEAVRNAVQHAGARHVSVGLDAETGTRVLRLEVIDDGAGFDPAAVDPRRLGLVGMRERAVAIGGHLAIATEPGTGTRVHLSVPIPRPPAGASS